MQAALIALSNVGPTDVVVTLSGTTYTLTWDASLGNINAPTATITSLVQVVGCWYSKGFRNNDITIFPDGTPSYTLKFVKSNQYDDVKPDFAAPVGADNQWEYTEVVDLESGADINGTTGVAIAATTTRTFEWNTNVTVWV